MKRARAERDAHDARARAIHDSPVRGDVRSRASAARTRAVPSLDEALEVARDACHHALGMTPRYNQLLTALLLLAGRVVELPTGEGKTLAGALGAATAWLCGERTRVMTTNDYLAGRDVVDMQPLFSTLGARVGAVTSRDGQPERDLDVVYGSTRAHVFRWLRDQRALGWLRQCTERADFLIVDEADSVLLDAASSPFVLSRETEDPDAATYATITPLVERLRSDRDFRVDGRSVTLTEEGIDRIEAALREAGCLSSGQCLHDDSHGLAHIVRQCLFARALFVRDRDYLVEHGRAHIIDRFTGRSSPSRRWAAGLHQAIEAKERLTIRPRHGVVGRTTIGAFLRLHSTVAGMTGTTRGADDELLELYGLPVSVVEPDQPSVRVDEPDVRLSSQAAKVEAIALAVEEARGEGRPVLVGTSSEEEARFVSETLASRAIPHASLTARDHANEAELCARAGEPGRVTVATQVAGRGTDIELPQASRDAGGLLVLGFARATSRRVDDQLRGRAGRRGQPGTTRFHVAPDDAIFADTELADADAAQREHERRHTRRREAIARVEKVLHEQQHAFLSLRQRIVDGTSDREAPTDIVDRVREAVRRIVAASPNPSMRLYARFGVRVDGPNWAERVASGLAWQREQLRGFLRVVMHDLVEEADSPREVAELHLEVLGAPMGEVSACVADELARPWLQALTTQLRRVPPRLVFRHFRILRLRELDRAWTNVLAAQGSLRDDTALEALAIRRPEEDFRRRLHDLLADEWADARARTFRGLRPSLFDDRDALRRRVSMLAE